MVDLTQNIPAKKSRQLIVHALIFAISLVLSLFLIESQTIHSLLRQTQNISPFSAFLAGLFFSTTFTAIPATATLFILGQNHPPIIISAIAAIGSLFTDIFILKLIKNDVIVDLETLITKQEKRWLIRVFRSKVLHLPLIVVAAAIIASPLPDELGIFLLDLVKFKTKHFYLLSFLLNFLGIYTITYLGSLT